MGSGSTHLTIEQNTDYLKRYAFLERGCMRTLAGWLAGVPEWEAKNAIGLHIWESAEAVDALYLRLKELRIYQPERHISSGLQKIAVELDFAQNTAEVVAAVYLVVKSALLDAYQAHCSLTWREYDNPTVKVIEERLVPLATNQITWAKQFLSNSVDRYEHWENWQTYIAVLISAAGGVTGSESENGHPPSHSRDLLLPWHECQRMPDWPIFDPASDVEPDRHEQAEAHRLWRFKHYLNEMTAAETLATILWMTPEMPWEYQHNVARHQWDEIRHSQLGMSRIQQLGLHVSDVPQVVQIYNVMMKLPPVEQYALLTTIIEPNGMSEKMTNRAHWEQLDDEISAAAVSYDWSDENFHIRWGKKWTPVLLETYGYKESPEETKTRLEDWLIENTPVKMQVRMSQSK